MLRTVLINALLASVVAAHDKVLTISSVAVDCDESSAAPVAPPTFSTTFQTSVKTIISCGPEVPDCPGATPHPHPEPTPVGPPPFPTDEVYPSLPICFPGGDCDELPATPVVPASPVPTYAESSEHPVAPSVTPSPGVHTPVVPIPPPVIPASPVAPISPVYPISPASPTPGTPIPATPTAAPEVPTVPTVPVAAGEMNRPLAGICLGVAAIVAVNLM
ncbi:hypothetical protein GMORB2_2380 [Geosmithia morbida]|uniref:Uncharacterized protein n=1 Tax=Geosmithia morbida TaxID=1094350 RepID=A0A9P4YSC2_9HYPO|nr:uncharacterized protein GMORB2_2380 [Geosmithia morbida]KAF4120894.1 hypothetical protein GMORB2_2380 [Geosmithia morbida]